MLGTVRASRSNQRGQALVEAAMILLLLFMAIFAIFEGGRLIQTQQMLTNAARLGARLGIAPLTGTSDLLEVGAIEPQVKSFLRSASLDPARSTVSLLRPVSVLCSTCPSGFASYTRVTVTYNYQVMTLSMFGALNMTLTGQSLMRNETSE